MDNNEYIIKILESNHYLDSQNIGISDNEKLIITLNYILFLMMLSERTFDILEGKKPIWYSSIYLSQRRKPYEFDENLQQMLNYKEINNLFAANEIRCGKSGYYRTEISINKNYIIHVINITTSKKRKYREKYYQLNHNLNDPHYFFFEYTLSKDYKKYEKIELIIPDSTGKTSSKIKISELDHYRKMFNHKQIDESTVEEIFNITIPLYFSDYKTKKENN